MIEHAFHLEVSSRAKLSILYFSDRETRWLFSYHYRGERDPGTDPEIVNDVRLTADYKDGQLIDQFVLSMHIVIPSRLGKRFFAGMDISPGAKTYFEFLYERQPRGFQEDVYRLIEICKGANTRLRVDEAKGFIQTINSPFPILDQIAITNMIYVPFRTNAGTTAYFELPWSTVR